MSSKKFFRLQLAFLAVSLAIVLFPLSSHFPAPIRILCSLIVLITTLPLPGFHSTFLLENIFRQRFSFLERLNIAALIAILFLPFCLSIEYTATGIISTTMPLLNAGIILLLSRKYIPALLPIPSFSIVRKTSIFPTAVVAAIAYTALTTALVTAYYPLPDSDPYYWLATIEQTLNTNTPTPLHLYRPLFSILAFIFHQTAHVDLYAFFKYVLPFLTPLVLLPAMLIARRFPTKLQQLAILLLPLASASFIIYLELPIPQAVTNITACFFIFFLLYSWFERKTFFYFFGGVSFFVSYFYHEISILFFLPWFLITLIYYRRELWKWITENRLSSTLAAILLFSYSPALLPMYGFIKNWLNRTWSIMTLWQTNLTFPLSYVNIDGKAVGWENFSGVLKYYAFYVGPTVSISILLLFFIFLKKRTRPSTERVRKKEFLVLATTFFLFFSIAEILPRLFNIALLPERSWGFAGLFLTASVPCLFRYSYLQERYKQWIAGALILSIGMNAGAALSMNALKKYLITPEQLASAEWIEQKLPKESIIFTKGNGSMLRTYAHVAVIETEDPKLYYDIHIFDALTGKKQDASATLEKNYQDYLIQTSSRLETWKASSSLESIPEKIKHLTTLNQRTSEVMNTFESFLEDETQANEYKKAPKYIFYSKPSAKNPYANRPYFKETSDNASPNFAFDSFPDRFRRVYVAPHEEVIIWKVKD